LRSRKTSTRADDSAPPLLGALLRFSWQKLRESLLEALHEAGFADLNAAHINVFQYPSPEGSRPIDLAARASMSRQAMNYLLSQLEAMGYLTRVRSGQGTAAKVTLTEKGRQVGALLRSEVKRIETEWAGVLGQKRFDELLSSLKEMNGLH